MSCMQYLLLCSLYFRRKWNTYLWNTIPETLTWNTIAIVRPGFGDYVKDNSIDRKKTINKNTIDVIDLMPSECITHQGVWEHLDALFEQQSTSVSNLNFKFLH